MVAQTTYVLEPATHKARKSAVVVVMPRRMTTEDRQKIELKMYTIQDSRSYMRTPASR